MARWTDMVVRGAGTAISLFPRAQGASLTLRFGVLGDQSSCILCVRAISVSSQTAGQACDVDLPGVAMTRKIVGPMSTRPPSDPVLYP